MKRVTGIGGIFFKAQNPKAMYEWYERHLGLERDPTGSCVVFPWREQASGEEGMTIWSMMPATTEYFEPSRAPFMINYRVEDLDAVLAALRSEGVTIAKGIEDSEFGRFAWIMDPEGNRIELWQPPKNASA
jgi:predicted enzyme related to lactoylglutathione lyase